MKKGLSVLLIVAALFGFYGGATSLNDILASKDYWEEVGEKSTADMNKLEDGLNQLKDNEKAYLDGQKELADGEVKLADAEKQLEAGRAELAQGYADYAAAPAKLRAGEKAVSDGEKELTEGRQTLDNGYATLKTLQTKLNTLKSGFGTWEAGWKAANTPSEDLGGKSAVEALGLADKYGRIRSSLIDPQGIMKAKGAAALKLKGTLVKKLGEAGYAEVLAAIGESDITASNVESVFTKLVSASKPEKIPNPYYDPEDPTKGPQYIPNPYHAYYGMITEGQSDLNSSLSNLEAMKALEPGRDYMADELLTLLNKLAKDKDTLEALGGMAALNQIKAGLNDKASDAAFDATVNACIDKAEKLIKQNKKKLAQGEKTYKAGLAKLNAGKAELAQGYADYAAAPGKLADGEKKLADGEAQYADGKKQLEDGKKQLAQYEDGEQQVRDGLATLMATEADPGLESILDRRNGDDKFDDANGHLMLDEGLEAVETGRGYQADSGDLITKEITNRGIGTAAGLAAGALAVLAAILSFLKKNKGAAVSAVLAAVAGGVGAGVGLSAGEYYSDIAGSTVGNTPFIAAAILAAVAAVFAIVHFTAKPETK